MKREWERLLLLTTALALAILVVAGIHQIIESRISGPPERLIAALEVAVFVLITAPVLINEAIRIVGLLTHRAHPIPAHDPLTFRYVFCLIVGFLGSAGIYGTFLHFRIHDFPSA